MTEPYEFAEQLSKMPQQERLKALDQLILNLLDYHQQTDEEQLYIILHDRIDQEIQATKP